MLNPDQSQSQLQCSQKRLKRQYILIGLLAALCIFLFFSRRHAVVQQEASYAHGLELKTEYDSLMDEYTSIKLENQDLTSQLSERDSAIMANAKEIHDLINSQADYKKIKKKLELLRKITQDYVARVDSLVVVNKELNEENLQIKNEITVERRKNTELIEDKAVLETKVTEASVLKAYNLIAATMRRRGDDKEVPTDKAKRLDRIFITFTLSENKIIPSGSKTIYIRIARPDGEILSEGQGDEYSFEIEGGDKLQYSIAKTIDYKNIAQEVSAFWDKKDMKQPAMPGLYTVMVYVDGNDIGKATFIVKP